MREKVFSLNSDPRESHSQSSGEDNRETLIFHEMEGDQGFKPKATAVSSTDRFSDFDTRMERANAIVDYPGLNTELKEGESAALILYRYRWLVLFSFFLSSASIGAVQGSLSTTKKII